MQNIWIKHFTVQKRVCGLFPEYSRAVKCINQSPRCPLSYHFVHNCILFSHVAYSPYRLCFLNIFQIYSQPCGLPCNFFLWVLVISHILPCSPTPPISSSATLSLLLSPWELLCSFQLWALLPLSCTKMLLLLFVLVSSTSSLQSPKISKECHPLKRLPKKL